MSNRQQRLRNARRRPNRPSVGLRKLFDPQCAWCQMARESALNGDSDLAGCGDHPGPYISADEAAILRKAVG